MYAHSSGSSVVPFGAGHGLLNIYCSLKASIFLYSAVFHVDHFFVYEEEPSSYFIRVSWDVHGTVDLGVD